MKLVYDINDKPPIKKNLIYAFQQLLAIMAATLLVPILLSGCLLFILPLIVFYICIQRKFMASIATSGIVG